MRSGCSLQRGRARPRHRAAGPAELDGGARADLRRVLEARAGGASSPRRGGGPDRRSAPTSARVRELSTSSPECSWTTRATHPPLVPSRAPRTRTSAAPRDRLRIPEPPYPTGMNSNAANRGRNTSRSGVRISSHYPFARLTNACVRPGTCRRLPLDLCRRFGALGTRRTRTVTLVRFRGGGA